MSPVAVIDIGSNTLKILVAEGSPLRVIAEATEEIRLSPRADEPSDAISPRAQAEAVGAIARLLEVARKNGAVRTRLVATSMVRDAANGAAFRNALYLQTGYDLEILDGVAEARGIAAGVATDPALAGADEMRIFDLGGGSLEYIFHGTTGITSAKSWPLGAVRMTRAFIANPTAPIPAANLAKLAAHLRDALLPTLGNVENTHIPVVGCGGAFSVSRAILAIGAGTTFEASSPVLPVSALRTLCDRLASMPLIERVKIPGLPASRADILPAALTTLLVVAQLTGAVAFTHSRRNLRYGIAAKMLAE